MDTVCRFATTHGLFVHVVGTVAPYDSGREVLWIARVSHPPTGVVTVLAYAPDTSHLERDEIRCDFFRLGDQLDMWARTVLRSASAEADLIEPAFSRAVEILERVGNIEMLADAAREPGRWRRQLIETAAHSAPMHDLPLLEAAIDAHFP